jgi:hypothetical protein
MGDMPNVVAELDSQQKELGKKVVFSDIPATRVDVSFPNLELQNGASPFIRNKDSQGAIGDSQTKTGQNLRVQLQEMFQSHGEMLSWYSASDKDVNAG